MDLTEQNLSAKFGEENLKSDHDPWSAYSQITNELLSFFHP
jgi:hypothetical protein